MLHIRHSKFVNTKVQHKLPHSSFIIRHLQLFSFIIALFVTKNDTVLQEY